MTTFEVNFLCDTPGCRALECSDLMESMSRLPAEFRYLERKGWSVSNVRGRDPHLLCPDCLRKGKTHPWTLRSQKDSRERHHSHERHHSQINEN